MVADESLLDPAPDAPKVGVWRFIIDARHQRRGVGPAKGMSQVAKEAGVSRESLYRALSADGNPSFATVLKVARALGVRLHAQPA